MLSLLLAVEAPKAAGNGAPVWQIGLVAGGTTLVTALTLWLIAAYRRGQAAPLRAASRLASRVTGVPGWASLPAIIALIGGAVALGGAEWDIALHIDEGRDDGPLGTAAHYPILIGLLTLFVSGLLAVGMAPPEGRGHSRVALRIRGLWPVPISAALLLAASSMAFLAFPLDDLWHRVFGQDVTLWGPTHIMLIACAVIGVLAAALLMVEGARSVGRDAASPPGRRWLVPVPVMFALVILVGFTLEMDEFNFGVPQFRLVWHPVLIVVASSLAFVVARVWGGRGAALQACVLAFVAFIPLTLAVHFVFGQTFHAQPLYLAEALAVELLAFRGMWRRPVAFGAVAGAVVAVVGFAAEYGWTQLVFRLPWTTNLIPEGVPMAIVAGVAAGVLGALLAEAITGRLRLGRAPFALAVVAGVVLIAVGVRAAHHDEVEGASVTIVASDVRDERTPGKGGVQPTADIAVRFSGTEITDRADWVRILAWQGHGSFSNVFEQQADGSWRSTERVPVGGAWRTILNVNGRGTVLGAPVYMPADPPVGFAGFPLQAEVTRRVGPLEEMAQIERKPDAPTWAWRPATWTVLGINLLLLIGLGWGVVRVGRPEPGGGDGPTADGEAAAGGPDDRGTDDRVTQVPQGIGA